LAEQVNQLEKAILQESISPTSATTQDMQNFQEAVASRKALLDNLRRTKASGRMIIKLASLSELKEGRYDFILEPQDTLKIPPIPSTVTVMGEVYNQTSMIYVPGKTVKYYLDQTGGLTMNADADSIFVIRTDGSVVSRRQNRGFLLRNFYQTEIERGDTILVPKDIARFSWLNTTKDLTEILFKIASTTGITITAFK
jgi:protein involved in polysaccharide export with SLBB domain